MLFRSSPSGISSYSSLITGIARYHLGQYDASIESLEQSMKLRRGGDSYEFMYLAGAHLQNGRKDEALRWYDKGVRWIDAHPDSEPLIRNDLKTRAE